MAYSDCKVFNIHMLARHFQPFLSNFFTIVPCLFLSPLAAHEVPEGECICKPGVKVLTFHHFNLGMVLSLFVVKVLDAQTWGGGVRKSI